MHLPHIIASQSVVWMVAAALLLFFPARLTALFGPDLPAYGLAVTRVFASELMGLAIASWFTRSQQSSATGLKWAYLISNTLGFAVCLGAVRGGVMKPLAWALVALYLIYALLFAYSLLAARQKG